MRSVVALTLALLLAPTLASASQEEPRDALAMTIVGVDDVATSVSWSPAPVALLYEVYRGPSMDELTLLGTTPSTSFLDMTESSEDTVWYVVIGRAVSQSVGEHLHTMRGKCVATRGTTGYSVTLAHCMPTETPV